MSHVLLQAEGAEVQAMADPCAEEGIRVGNEKFLQERQSLGNTAPWLGVAAHPPRCLSSLLGVAGLESESRAPRPR